MLELYGTRSCPYTRELRESLEWNDEEFVEYDVDEDEEAMNRLRSLAPEPCGVPVLVEEGRVRQAGWQGRMCMV